MKALFYFTFSWLILICTCSVSLSQDNPTVETVPITRECTDCPEEISYEELYDRLDDSFEFHPQIFTLQSAIPTAGSWIGTRSSSFTVTGDSKVSQFRMTVPFWTGTCRITALYDIPIGIVGWYTSIALDSDGRPHISYYDVSHQDLRYAIWEGMAWRIEIIDTEGAVGSRTSLALDAQDNPHIIYYDDTHDDLKYARLTENGWAVETVDSDGSVGGFNSLDLDATGKPHVCYYDDTNDDLKYARLTENGWAVEIVDSDGSVGWYTSLALDVTDKPHISYYDNTNDDLKYAMWDGNQWIRQAVDTTENVGTYTSLDLDVTGKPSISYYDDTNDDLKYARWIENGWDVETVDYIGAVGRFTSLSLDITGNPHISYLDATNWDLKYARFTESGWDIETADNGGNVGRYNSLAVDAAGNPHIAYYDDIEGDLCYTTSTGSTWNRESVDSIVGDRFFISDIGLTIEGEFDTPESLTGNYSVFYCGNMFIIPPSTGTWTASLEQIAAPEVPSLVSPGDEEEGVTTNPTLIWNASARTTSYHLQVSTMESFSTTIVDQSAITDTTYAVGTLANDNTYFWRVNATNEGGTSDWSTTFSFTTKILTAKFSADPTTGFVPFTTQFTDSSTGEITDWLWDFGDNQTSTEQHPSHTYETADTFSVSLTVTNPDGSDTITRDDYIIVLEQPPVANFGADTTFGYLPFTVQFTDSSTGAITSWLWSFGDKETSTEQHPSHTYETADTFSVSLTVTGPGGSNSKTRDDYIIVLEPPPVANFGADTTFGYLPFTVQFTDSSTGAITSWFWSFGDNETSTEQHPEHTYETAGIFSVSLTVTGPGGSDTITRDDCIYVNESTNIEDFITKIPDKYHLYQNYPNPFNPSTQIKFALPRIEHVKIEVYSLIGRKIETILDNSMPAGYHEIEFNGQNLSSGVYLYRIEADEWQDVKKMIILK